MHEWYKGGFFTMDLLVKREQDTNFEPLGVLIRKIGSDEKPFLHTDLHAAAPLARPNLSLAQNRQGSGLGHFNSSSWGGISAPSTPGTPSFGVDRMFQPQQQQQQQYSSGDLFGGSGNPLQHQQQQQLQPTQDSFSGLDQKWNSGLFGPSQGLDSNVGGAGGWAGDAFSRSSMGNLGGPQTPLGGNFMNQQGRLLNQQLERQQYMQLLQRQIQMQHILHQQQFMAAQQQFGNDPHALSSLLAQQQAQQRQLQMRLQQVQHMGFHGVGGVTTPGGSAMPWGGLGQQPSSPWSSSIIQPSSDNYFEYGNGDNNNGGHSMMQQQQQRDQPQSFTQQTQQQLQQQHQDIQEPHASKPAEVEDSVQAVAQDLEKLEFADTSRQQLDEQAHRTSTTPVAEYAQEDVLEETTPVDHHEPAAEEVKEEEEKIESIVVKERTEEKKVKAEEPQAKEEPQQETFESETEEEHETEFDQEHDDSKSAITEDASEDVSSESGWGVAPEQQQQPRVIKAVPAPWAKPSRTDDSSEKKAPTLREIQEMEAKRAEEIRSAERQAQAAAATAGLLDFGKGLGGTPWQTASAPKKKTLREIQEEEEAALKRARSAQTAAQPVASAPVSSTGLAGIVASGTGSVGKRYADTIGPKPVTVSANAGPWGTPSSVNAAKPLSMSRTTSAYASATSLSSSAASSPAVRAVDTNSWIEVDNKRGNKPSIETPAPAPAPIVRAPVHNVNRNSDEPRPASEEFLRWCRQALKGLQNVVLEDFIQMLLSFPLNPDPMTVEIIQDSIYANSQSLNGRQFADEFIKRRKADAYPNGMGPVSASTISASAGGHDSSFKVVSKKGKKKN
jgi:hypothetical protein